MCTSRTIAADARSAKAKYANAAEATKRHSEFTVTTHSSRMILIGAQIAGRPDGSSIAVEIRACANPSRVTDGHRSAGCQVVVERRRIWMDKHRCVVRRGCGGDQRPAIGTI